MRFLNIFLCAFLLVACAQTPTEVSPQVRVNPTDMGGGWRIFVKVVDTQNDKQFGQRQWGVGKDEVPAQDIQKAVEKAATKALETVGFSPETDDDTVFRSLNVEIKRLNYRLLPGNAITSNVEADTEFFVTATNQKENFKRSYTLTQTRGVVLKPSQKQNLKLLDDVLSNIMETIFRDEELLHFLSKN